MPRKRPGSYSGNGWLRSVPVWQSGRRWDVSGRPYGRFANSHAVSVCIFHRCNTWRSRFVFGSTLQKMWPSCRLPSARPVRAERNNPENVSGHCLVAAGKPPDGVSRAATPGGRRARWNRAPRGGRSGRRCRTCRSSPPSAPASWRCRRPGRCRRSPPCRG